MVRIRGSYALAVMFNEYPEEIYVARKDSPMILGIEDGESYIASDVPAILKYTRNVYYIGNMEMARVRKGEITFYNLDGDEIEKELKTIDWNAEAAEKAGYEHFMMKEIHEQPKCVGRYKLILLLKREILFDLTDIGLSEEDIKKISQMYIVACGSAYHVGIAAQYVIEDLAKIPLLEIEDIGKEPRKIIGQPETKEGITMLYNDLFTNGIGYLDIVFDCTDLPEKYQSYMGLLKPVLSYMDTEKHSYTELNTEIDLDLGGFAFDSGIYVNKKTGEPMLTGEVHAKMLYDKIPKTFDLIKEVVLETKFDDYKRLKEILEELKSRVKSSIIKTGDSAAMLRAMSYYSKSYYLKEQSTGLAFYQFLSDI